MKCCKIVNLVVAAVLAVIVVVGCDPDPAGKTQTSSTNFQSSLPVPIAGQSSNLPAVSKSLPLRTIISLRLDQSGEDSKTLVRVHGTVLDGRPGQFIVVYDGTGTVFAETHQTVLPKVKEIVDLQGEPISDGSSVTLKNAVVVLADEGSTTNGVSRSVGRPAQLPTLTNVWEIRDLPAEKAAWNYPVQLHGVVTVNSKRDDQFFVQDQSAGIFVLMKEIPTNLNPGDWVRIEGVSDPGGYAPIVLASNVTVTGQASLPVAQPETVYQLATGQAGSQWIEVRGVVRSMSLSNDAVMLNLSDPSGMIPVKVPVDSEPTHLLDAVVRIQGVCVIRFNDRHQLVGFEMRVSSLDNICVEEPGVADPLSQSTQPIASLSQFHPRQTLQHRLTIAGIVTYVDQHFFFIQDGEEGVRVNTTTTAGLKLGDYVIAAGYPGLGNYGNLLSDAVFKVVSHRQMPVPQPLSEEHPLVPEFHDRWVQIQARFLRYDKLGTTDVLTLQTGNRIFVIRTLSLVSDRIKNLQPGTDLLVKGIYRVLSDEARVPKSFQLAVSEESDIQILSEPSWWTLRHLFVIVGGMAVIIGTTILWVLVLRRKVQEQTASLQQSESKFRSLVEQSLVGVYIIQNGGFVYANPRLAEIFGYSVEELTAPGVFKKIFISEDLQMVQEHIRRRIAGEVDFAHYFFRGRRKDGAIIDIEVLGSRAEFKGEPAVIGMLVDVTERKQAQDKIAAQARMLDLASDAIMVCDLAGRILFWNQSAQRIYGWTALQAVGGLACEKIHISPSEFEQTRQKLLKEQNWRGEFVHRDSQRGETLLETRWTLVHDSQGKPDSILTISTDITQQKKLESQFLRAQRLESIGVLAGGIAHDLNNTLAPILLCCHLLENERDSSERKEWLASILASAERAANLVRQILTFARGTDGRRLVVQPHYLLEELRKILGQILPKTIELQTEIADKVWPILADATQIHQVLMNLCINARDAMPSGGKLTVSAANCELDELSAAISPGAKPGAYVIFSITDNGSGIPREIHERIFDPFFTTKDIGKGTGLGLSTCLGIVKSHGGFIQVYSEPNQGSCFKVYLPAQPDGQSTDGTSDGGGTIIRGNNELILVVDDEEFVRNLAKQTLKMFGYRVHTAKDGAEAIACYLRQKDEIAAVLLDMMMPVLGGVATIHALVQINPEVKIIAASGLTSEGEVAHKASPAVRAFIQKPYTAEYLLKVFQEVLRPKS